MERDRMRNGIQNPPPALADSWLADRLFNPSDIARIEDAAFQWYTERHNALLLRRGPRDDPSFSEQLAGIALDTGTKLESQLEDRKQFHHMMQVCAHRLSFGNDESSCFAPKRRFTPWEIILPES